MSEAVTLHDQLTAALTGALTEMWQPEVGHSCTGDLPALTDDAKVLARVADAILGQRARDLEAKLAAIDRIHGTYHAGPDSAEYCTGCGKPHPCPTRAAAR